MPHGIKGSTPECSILGCTDPAVGRGWCGRHYARWRKRGTTDLPEPHRAGTCAVSGCDEVNDSHGMCGLHAQRWRKHGDPHHAPPLPLERWMAKVDIDGPIPAHNPALGPCWTWRGTISRRTGYGQFSEDGRTVSAYKWGYLRLVGRVRGGIELDHLCHDYTTCTGGVACTHRRCVNPYHLEAVTQTVNRLRSNNIMEANARKTECKHGHPFDEENTYITPEGRRHCRTCGRAAVRRYQAKRAEE